MPLPPDFDTINVASQATGMGDPQVSDGRSRLSSLTELDQLLPQAGAGGKRAVRFFASAQYLRTNTVLVLCSLASVSRLILSNGNTEVLLVASVSKTCDQLDQG